MINLKFIGILAVFGFLLSFVLGLTGDVSFGYVFLRAVVSALVSGGTAALVSFVFRKFLSENTAETLTAKASSTPGNIVDIRVEEEPLPDTENSPDFYVSQTHVPASNAFPYRQTLKESPETLKTDPVKEKPAAVFDSAKTEVNTSAGGESLVVEKRGVEPKVEAFVPTPLAQKSIPVTGKADSTDSKNDMSEKTSVSEELDSLSELPDIESMVSDSLESDSSIIEDSVFASEGTPNGSEGSEISAGNDTSLIADAIRTLLKREG
ncbi:MAG: hypothetical protein K5930_07910 [Treponemataceae bacterium]|nr:hypothetical protein [Treponemataceae bacterium]